MIWAFLAGVIVGFVLCIALLIWVERYQRKHSSTGTHEGGVGFRGELSMQKKEA